MRSAARDALALFTERRWLVIPSLVLTPIAAVAITLLIPASYRSTATLAFTGRNTGTSAGDVAQGARALSRDRSLSARALDVTGIVDLSPARLQSAARTSRGSQPNLMQLTVELPHQQEDGILCAALARQLARDQLASVVHPASAALMVGPAPLVSAVLGLVVGLLLISVATVPAVVRPGLRGLQPRPA